MTSPLVSDEGPEQPEVRKLRVFPAPDEPQYDSLGEAIRSVVSTARTTRAERDQQLLLGSEVLSCEVGDEFLALALSEDRWLYISCVSAAVDWEVCATRPALAEVPSALRFALDFGSGSTYMWERQALADALVGKKIRYLAASHAWLFMAVDGEPQYMFSRLLQEPGRIPLLYFDHDPE